MYVVLGKLSNSYGGLSQGAGVPAKERGSQPRSGGPSQGAGDSTAWLVFSFGWFAVTGWVSELIDEHQAFGEEADDVHRSNITGCLANSDGSIDNRKGAHDLVWAEILIGCAHDTTRDREPAIAFV